MYTLADHKFECYFNLIMNDFLRYLVCVCFISYPNHIITSSLFRFLPPTVTSPPPPITRLFILDLLFLSSPEKE